MIKKRVLLVLLLGFCSSQLLTAQDTPVGNGASAGVQLNEYQQDFGMGAHLTSPWFANQKIAVRSRNNVLFHEHLQDGETTWTPYLNATLGVAGKTGSIGDFIRLYGEGGVVGLFPNKIFSSKAFEFGGYGLFGFEFYMNPDANYFIEIGAVGTGAKANRISGSPIYSNGLTISTGFHCHIFKSKTNTMKNSHHSETENKTDSNNSFYHQHKPLILGMGGGVLLGIVMGSLWEDPALGMAFGIAVGSGAWYSLSAKEKNK